MKQSLQLKVSQNLTMTPQLQQAIRLLQLSSLDLQQEIQNTLEENPLLELQEEEENRNPETDAEPAPNNDAIADDSSWEDSLPENSTLDNRWEENFSNRGSSDSGEYSLEARNAATESLHDHLMWQLNMSRMNSVDRLIGMAIIDGIDDDGRLALELEDILEAFADNPDIEIEEVLAVLRQVQQFDPPGVGFRDLQECLLIQLRQLPNDADYRDAAIDVVAQHLPLLADNDYSQLQRRTKMPEDTLRAALELLRTLTPCPGSAISDRSTEYVVPDIFVSKHQGRWQVKLNPDSAPRIRINSQYASMARKCGSASDNAYIKDNLQEARWFLKSLESRNDTLLKVANKIVEVQRGFFDHGDEAMRPLVLHHIAEAVELHESTISRVTTQKYMHTPRGIFELKYFFSSHVSTDSGGEFSSTAIRALIRKMVAAENPKKPLSDNKIAGVLEQEGIQVARRTIAKYRESMSIPSSSERKRLV